MPYTFTAPPPDVEVHSGDLLFCLGPNTEETDTCEHSIVPPPKDSQNVPPAVSSEADAAITLMLGQALSDDAKRLTKGAMAALAVPTVPPIPKAVAEQLNSPAAAGLTGPLTPGVRGALCLCSAEDCSLTWAWAPAVLCSHPAISRRSTCFAHQLKW